MQKTISSAWSFLFDHEVSPLRHIPHFNTRHMVLQLLGWMWAVAFSVALGSYTVFAVSVIGHAVRLPSRLRPMVSQQNAQPCF